MSGPWLSLLLYLLDAALITAFAAWRGAPASAPLIGVLTGIVVSAAGERVLTREGARPARLSLSMTVLFLLGFDGGFAGAALLAAH